MSAREAQHRFESARPGPGSRSAAPVPPVVLTPRLALVGGRGRGPAVASLARRIQATAGNRALRRALTPASANKCSSGA